MTPFKAVLFRTLLTTLVSTGLGRVCRADETPREAAAAHYARGVELANQGAYQAALEQFNDAYAISPHFAVLYNIGQAQIALGHPLEAIAALSKYLRDGAEQVPPSRRQQVQAQLSLLDARIAEPPPPEPATAPPRPRAPPPEAAPMLVPPAAARRHPGQAMRRLSYGLAGAGLLAEAGALGAYLWNRGRYQEWQRGDALLRDPMVGPNIQRRQIDIDNELAETLTTANRVILGLGIAGGALIACGATLFLLGTEERHRAGELSFAWGGWGGDAIASVAWKGRW